VVEAGAVATLAAVTAAPVVSPVVVEVAEVNSPLVEQPAVVGTVPTVVDGLSHLLMLRNPNGYSNYSYQGSRRVRRS